MVRIRPSDPITTPEPVRRCPSVSAERAPSTAVTSTPTTAALARIKASMTSWGAAGEDAWVTAGVGMARHAHIAHRTNMLANVVASSTDDSLCRVGPNIKECT